MTTTATPTAALDEILALQLTIAWAGEGLCQPKRLDWWRTDLIDDAGGGDLFARLLPRTKAWASLEAARIAAARADRAAREQMAPGVQTPSHARTSVTGTPSSPTRSTASSPAASWSSAGRGEAARWIGT